MKKRIFGFILTTIAFVLLISARAYAVPIVSYTETEAAGIYQYDFTLSTTESTDFVFELFLDIPVLSGDVLDVYAPIGWGSFSDPFAPGFLAWGDNGFGGTFIDASADFGVELFGIGELTGFGFTSTSQALAPILFSTNFDFILSEATLAASVPEPATLPLLSIGILMAWFTGRKRKMRVCS